MDCLPTAFSIVLGIPKSKIYEIIGHDGTEIIWPDLPKPHCYRSFHIGEMCNCCFELGWVAWPTSTCFELVTITAPPCSLELKTNSKFIVNPLFDKILESRDGVFIGESDGLRHAAAWHNQKLINAGEKFIADEFWVIDKVEGMECRLARSSDSKEKVSN